jgi:pimeloyl-ACP methyl ester carboxylesterase
MPHLTDDPSATSAPPPVRPTLVLVHGAGHTARVWDDVRSHLQAPSLAVNLPGRADRPADLATLTIDESADSAARDVMTVAPDRIVLVGHSAGGIVLPAIASRLGQRVEHLVFLAGLNAPDGQTVGETLWRAENDPSLAIERLRERPARRMLEPAEPDGAVALDARVAMRLESLNLMSQVVSWDGVPASALRTFVRCTRDRIQPPAMQQLLIESCAASRVVDVDAGHNAALEVPETLAAILDDLASLGSP